MHAVPASRRLLALLPIVLFAACGGDNLTLPSEGEPAKIEVVSGNGQRGRVGETLAKPLVVLVTDSKGRPVAGTTVVFVPAASSAEASPDTVTTDSDGQASSQLLLGTEVGDAGGTVHVVTSDGQQPVETAFTATALPASANGLAAVSGEGQTAPAGQALPDSLVVQVADAFGNPVEGVDVTWAPPSGGSVSAATTTTGAEGRTGITATLGPTASTQTFQASSEGLAGSPVSFSATATAGSAAGVHVVSGDNQSGQVGTELPVPLVVEVVDADGNPVPGAGITWTVTGGGGSVDPPTGTTDASGQASTHWTLGSLPITNTVEAFGPVGSATFTATATTGLPAALAMRTQPSSTAQVGIPFSRQPVVQLRDAQGNDVAQSGVAVTAARALGSGDLGGTITRSTDGNGRATFTDLKITGATGSHTLIFAASGYTSVSSSAIIVGKAPTTTQISSDLPDPSVAGNAVPVNFAVTSSGGTPTGNVTVTVSGGSETCTATVAAGSCAITLTGTGNRTLTASYAGDALFEASTDTEGHQVDPANQPPTADNDGYTVDEDNVLSVSAADGVLNGDSDPEGASLTAVLVTGPADSATTSFTLNSDGSFSFQPAPNFNGSVSFTYQANDGSLNSNIATVTITVTPVNDAPSFTVGPNQMAGPGESKTVNNWATNISPGPANESDQTLTFNVSIPPDKEGAFTDPPQISSSGTLTYTPSPLATFGIEVTVTVSLSDNGGTANNGVETSGDQTFTITIQ
jgi:hypothetical protein